MSTAASAISTVPAKAPKVPPYAPHQQYEIKGRTFKLTFVVGHDSRQPPSYKSADGTRLTVPGEALAEMQGMNMLRLECFTVAHIESLENDLDIWGLACCSRTEPRGYSREKGQRKALTAAMQMAKMSKELRTALWERFNKANPVGAIRASQHQRQLDELTDVGISMAVSAFVIGTMMESANRKMRRTSTDTKKMLPFMHMMFAQ